MLCRNDLADSIQGSGLEGCGVRGHDHCRSLRQANKGLTPLRDSQVGCTSRDILN